MGATAFSDRKHHREASMITWKMLLIELRNRFARRVAQMELESIQKRLEVIQQQRDNDFKAEAFLHRRSAEISCDLMRMK